MSDVNPGDILRLGAGLIYDGLYDVVGVWHVEVDDDSGLTWAQVTTSIQLWLDNVYDELKLTLSDQIGTGSVSVANVTQLTTLGSIPWSPTWGGAAAGDPTAAGVCLFAWNRTYKPRVQMRKYFGVFAESQVTDGFFVTAAREDAAAAMAYARAQASMGGNRTFQAVAYNTALGTFEYGVSTETSAEPAYQRRRKRGRGS